MKAADPAPAVPSAYADVFISHQRHDGAGAEALAGRIRALGHSCYLDAFDTRLAGKQAGDLADHIRSQLRGARALLFYFTPQAAGSKWMPWELGFFDGRWGKTTVGIYLAEADAASAPAPGGAPAVPAGFSIQEYLQIYQRVDDDNLGDFLRRAASFDTLANRSDVDVDRAMAMLVAAGRNPLAFGLGWQKYLLGMWRPALQGQPAALAQLDALIDWLGQAREQASALDAAAPAARGPGAAPDAWPAAAAPWAAWSQPWLQAMQQAMGQGVAASCEPVGPDRAIDPMARLRAAVVKDVQAAHDAAMAGAAPAPRRFSDASAARPPARPRPSSR